MARCQELWVSEKKQMTYSEELRLNFDPSVQFPGRRHSPLRFTCSCTSPATFEIPQSPGLRPDGVMRDRDHQTCPASRSI